MSTFLIATLLFIYVVNSDSGLVLKEWDQPENVSYDNGKYRVYFMQKSSLANHLRITNHVDQYLVVAKTGAKPELSFSFGHFKKYSLAESNFMRGRLKTEHVASYLNDCKVIWSESGVLFEEPLGYRLFIPSDAFL